MSSIAASAGVPTVPELRLTHRGRVVVALVAVAVAWATGSVGQAFADAPDAVPVVTRTVLAGETLWAIAGSLAAPGQDLRDVMDDLATLNGLSSSGLQAGQQLLVPAS